MGPVFKPKSAIFVLVLLLAYFPGQLEAQRAFTDHFSFFYTDALENDPPPVENPMELPPTEYDVTQISGGGGNPPPLPDYVVKLANWLEWAHSCYTTDGFNVPPHTNVKIGKPVQPGIVPNADWIHFHREKVSSDDIPGITAHELFHVVQLAYWKVYNLNRPVFVEGMTVAMENTVRPEVDRYQHFCIHANHRAIDDSQGLNWPHDFFDMGTGDWSDSYYTGIIWTYLMEHNGSGSTPRCPGTDFILSFLEATDVGGDPGPPGKQKLFDELDALLDAEGTTLEEQMRNFAFANMVRLCENFDGSQPYGFWWDDSWFDTSAQDFTFPGIDTLALFWEDRVLDLTEEGEAAKLDDGWEGEYVHPDGLYDEIVDEYGAAYWQYREDFKSLIEQEQGLAYEGPGLPYRVSPEIVVLSGAKPDVLSITGFRETDSMYHEAGTIRFNDDRVEYAAVAVTATGYSDYEFRHTVEAYEKATTESWGPIGGLGFEYTYRLPLSVHEILLRGITNAYDYHRGDVLSIVAYATNSGLSGEASEFLIAPPDFNYTVERLFQMNLRKLSAEGYYLNYSGTLLNPADQNDLTNLMIQSTPEDALLRLDLRQDPSEIDNTGLLLTMFPYDITVQALPDLLVRDYSFELDVSGRLTGKVAILNQGTDDISNARIPLFVETYKWEIRRPPELKDCVAETVLYDAPKVSLAAGATEVIDVDYETGWDWQDENEARPGRNYLDVTVEIGVNSLKGAEGPQIPPPDELTFTNNGPERIPVYCFFDPEDFPLKPEDLEEFVSWFEDETDDVMAAWKLDRSVPVLSSDFRKDIMEKAQDLSIFQYHKPWRADPPPEVPGSVFEAFRQVASWARRIGLQEHIPPMARQLCTLRNLSQLHGLEKLMEDRALDRGSVTAGRFFRGPAHRIPYVKLGSISLFQARLQEGKALPLDVLYCCGDPALDVFIKRSPEEADHPAMIRLERNLCNGQGPKAVELTLGGFNSCRLTAYGKGGNVVATAEAQPGAARLELSSTQAIRRITVTGTDICIKKIAWSCKPGFGGEEEFTRGDANGDGAIDIADPITILGRLFSGEKMDCLDAGDANDDGSLDISDVIYLLSYLYSSGTAPPPPEYCGPDATTDGLTCESYQGCDR